VPRYCQRCILPDDRPGVALDTEGVCRGCRNAADKPNIDWDARAAEFRRLADDVRAAGRDYDCLIPVSGGKDSFWQVVTCLEHGLHPLCMTYVYPGQSELGARNLRRLIDLGVDHFDFRLNPRVERAFIERTFRQTGISGMLTHMAIFTAPVRMALAYDIPLVVYGENTAFEYGNRDEAHLAGSRMDRGWLRSFGVSDGTTAEDWVDDDLTRQALAQLILPADDELSARSIERIFLGYYFPWDPENSRRVAVEHGFQIRAEGPRVGHYAFANVDDDMLGVHHHLKWHKFGITRTWDTLSMEIRQGRLRREQAIDFLHGCGDETPWDDIRVFCGYVGMPVGEYFAIAERFRNREIWSRRDGRWVIEDFLVPDFSWPDDPRIE
jgi:N-acetyl sugar amidotransferase